MTPPASNSDDTPQAESDVETTIHVRAAIDGDINSTSWIIERFTPLLLAQARYRIGPKLQRMIDPEDLVQDTWAVALPKLTTLPARGNRFTPVVVRFLSTTLLYTFNNLLRKHINRKESAHTSGEGGSTRPSPFNNLSADITGVVTHAVRVESVDEIHNAIEQLGEKDKEIIVLRGIEQNSLEDISKMLSITTKNASVRYGRALARLREAMPEAIFRDLPDD